MEGCQWFKRLHVKDQIRCQRPEVERTSTQTPLVVEAKKLTASEKFMPRISTLDCWFSSFRDKTEPHRKCDHSIDPHMSPQPVRILESTVGTKDLIFNQNSTIWNIWYKEFTLGGPVLYWEPVVKWSAFSSRSSGKGFGAKPGSGSSESDCKAQRAHSSWAVRLELKHHNSAG